MMNDDKIEKLKKGLEELESRITNLLGEDKEDDKMEKLRKHKRAMQEIQDYYSKKVS